MHALAMWHRQQSVLGCVAAILHEKSIYCMHSSILCDLVAIVSDTHASHMHIQCWGCCWLPLMITAGRWITVKASFDARRNMTTTGFQFNCWNFVSLIQFIDNLMRREMKFVFIASLCDSRRPHHRAASIKLSSKFLRAARNEINWMTSS